MSVGSGLSARWLSDYLSTTNRCRVLDLGSGSGRDCYVAAALVGERGSVTGVDMTPAQLAVARKHAEQYCTQVGGRPGRRGGSSLQPQLGFGLRFWFGVGWQGEPCRLPGPQPALHAHPSHRPALPVTVLPLPGPAVTQVLGYAAPNLRFVEGQIEDLAAAGIQDSSIDLIISNCVVGLGH